MNPGYLFLWMSFSLVLVIIVLAIAWGRIQKRQVREDVMRETARRDFMDKKMKLLGRYRLASKTATDLEQVD